SIPLYTQDAPGFLPPISQSAGIAPVSIPRRWTIRRNQFRCEGIEEIVPQRHLLRAETGRYPAFGEAADQVRHGSIDSEKDSPWSAGVRSALRRCDWVIRAAGSRRRRIQLLSQAGEMVLPDLAAVCTC